MTFRETLQRANYAVLDDGFVTLGETSFLLRAIAPFVAKGEAAALELKRALDQVRADGVITPSESMAIRDLLKRLASSDVQANDQRNIMTMPSANGFGCIIVEKILDSELKDKCGLYALVTIPKGSALGYHEHHGNGESYFILRGEGVYNDNGTKRVVGPGDSTWTPDGNGHGLDNSHGREDLVFMALIVNN